MTDHVKLLVALLSTKQDVPDGPFTTSAVVTMLYEIGHEQRRATPAPRERVSA
jgi:hypothetical protein